MDDREGWTSEDVRTSRGKFALGSRVMVHQMPPT